MQNREYKTRKDVLTRGQEAVGIPLKLIDQTGRLNTGKGAIGTVLEESWFGYAVNSEAAPDFEEAGVELKATPYRITSKGISAKERLVCNIIDYMTEYQNTFETSSFYRKCNTMLIMSYQHRDDIPKGDFTIDRAVLFSFPLEDLLVIRQDWEKIIAKIRDGKAHEISEGDTFYLGACTKGATAATVRPQPYSPIMAKQRAYSLKQSYMTYILQKYLFVVFQKDSEYDLDSKNPVHTEAHLRLKSILFWQLPEQDAEEAERVWKRTVAVINAGVRMTKVPYGHSFRIENNLPQSSESAVAHIRPHSKNAAYLINGEQIGNLRDADRLPDGRYMTKQCMWFNRGYIAKQLEKMLRNASEE